MENDDDDDHHDANFPPEFPSKNCQKVLLFCIHFPVGENLKNELGIVTLWAKKS